MTKRRDALGQPRVAVNWRLTESDRLYEEDLHGRSEEVPVPREGLYNFFGVGTMGYAAGSSVYGPSSGAANPTLTLVALAARLADHLLLK